MTHVGTMFGSQHVVDEQHKQHRCQHKNNVGTEEQRDQRHGKFTKNNYTQPIDFTRFEMVIQLMMTFTNVVKIF